MSATTTCAPSCAIRIAALAPRPEAPPVISATLPVRRSVIGFLLRRSCPRMGPPSRRGTQWRSTCGQSGISAKSRAGLGERCRQVATELLGEIDRNPGMDATLAVEQLDLVPKRHDRPVPDVGMDVEARSSVAHEGGELVGRHIIAR